MEKVFAKRLVTGLLVLMVVAVFVVEIMFYYRSGISFEDRVMVVIVAFQLIFTAGVIVAFFHGFLSGASTSSQVTYHKAGKGQKLEAKGINKKFMSLSTDSSRQGGDNKPRTTPKGFTFSRSRTYNNLELRYGKCPIVRYSHPIRLSCAYLYFDANRLDELGLAVGKRYMIHVMDQGRFLHLRPTNRQERESGIRLSQTTKRIARIIIPGYMAGDLPVTTGGPVEVEYTHIDTEKEQLLVSTP